MDTFFIPKINCRFKIRKDVDGHIGFFETKGILSFNEIGAFIVSQMTGHNNIQEIAELAKEKFSDLKKPIEEVNNIVIQFQKSGFL